MAIPAPIELAQPFHPVANHPSPPAAASSGWRERSLLTLGLPVLLVVLLVLLATGYAAHRHDSAQQQQAVQERQQWEADRLAAYLGGRMQALREELGRLAIADPALLEALASGDQQAQERQLSRLRQGYPQALQLRLIWPGQQQPESASSLGIGYASLELARIAETGGLPPVEIHRPGSPQQHLATVAPIQVGGEVVASLLLMLPLSLLEQWLGEAIQGPVLVELAEPQGTTLFRLGDPALAAATAYRAEVAGTNWQLRYGSGDTTAGAAKHGIFATFLLATAILGGFLVFYGAYLSRHVTEEMRALAGAVQEGTLGRRQHNYPVRLAEARRVLQEVDAELALHTADFADSNDLDLEPDWLDDAAIPDMLFTDPSAQGGEPQTEPGKGAADSTTPEPFTRQP